VLFSESKVAMRPALESEPCEAQQPQAAASVPRLVPVVDAAGTPSGSCHRDGIMIPIPPVSESEGARHKGDTKLNLVLYAGGLYRWASVAGLLRLFVCTFGPRPGFSLTEAASATGGIMMCTQWPALCGAYPSLRLARPDCSSEPATAHVPSRRLCLARFIASTRWRQL
jgi:hypothetical protein